MSLWSGWKVFKGEKRHEAKGTRQKARGKGKKTLTKTLANLNILRELFDTISIKIEFT